MIHLRRRTDWSIEARSAAAPIGEREEIVHGQVVRVRVFAPGPSGVPEAPAAPDRILSYLRRRSYVARTTYTPSNELWTEGLAGRGSVRAHTLQNLGAM